MRRFLFSSAALAIFVFVSSPTTATAQYGDIARAQAQAQLRAKALQRVPWQSHACLSHVPPTDLRGTELPVKLLSR